MHTIRYAENMQNFPKTMEPDDVRAWIREACASLKISPTALARRVGLSHTTLNRFLIRGPGAPKNLSGTTINAISHAFSNGESTATSPKTMKAKPRQADANSNYLQESDFVIRKAPDGGWYIENGTGICGAFSRPADVAAWIEKRLAA